MIASRSLSVDGAAAGAIGERGSSRGCSVCHPSKLKAEGGRWYGARASSSIASSAEGLGGMILRWDMLLVFLYVYRGVVRSGVMLREPHRLRYIHIIAVGASGIYPSR